MERTEPVPSFLESLDTAQQSNDLKNESKRVARLLKLSMLFSEKLLLTDSQLIDNSGIRNLLVKRGDVKEFLSENIIAGTRANFSSFNQLVSEWVEKGTIFSSFDERTKNRLLTLREKGELRIENFYRATNGKKYKDYIDIVDKLYKDEKKKREMKSFSNLSDMVSKSIYEKSVMLKKELDLTGICNELPEKAAEIAATKPKRESQKTPTVDRSDFYKAIEQYAIPVASKLLLKRVFIDPEYNACFWKLNNLPCVTNNNEEDNLLIRNAFSSLNPVEKKQSSNRVNVTIPLELPTAVHLDLIDFEFINEYARNSNTVAYKLGLRAESSEVGLKKAFADYLQYMANRIKKYYEDRKLNKLVKQTTVTLLAASIPLKTIGFSGRFWQLPFITPEISTLVSGVAEGTGIVLDAIGLLGIGYSIRQSSRYGEIEKILDKTELKIG